MRFLLPILALAPSVALADVTAVYGSPDKSFTMKLEVAGNGDVRGDVKGHSSTPGLVVSGGTGPEASMSLIRRGDQTYFIRPDPNGPIVTRVDDLVTVMVERSQQMRKQVPGFAEAMAQAPGLRFHFVPKGQVAVNGRFGTAYYMQLPGGGGLSPQPWAVVSDDPSLAPLKQAMAVQFEMSIKMMDRAGFGGPLKELSAVFGKGAPISYAGVELQSVSFAPIPASEFELRAAPETLEQTRERFNRENPAASPPALPQQP